MKIKQTLLPAILAGLCIALGGSAFLAIDNKIVGALFFTIGLFTICTRGYFLFTGKVGYAVGQPLSYWGELALIWLGNLIGTGLPALALRCTRVGSAMAEKARLLCEVKFSDHLSSLFFLALFCNLLMFIAVDGFRNNPHELGKYLSLFLGVSVFILCGFEHCIANMFYFSIAGVWSARTVFLLLVMTAGNVAGGLLIPLLESKKILKTEGDY